MSVLAVRNIQAAHGQLRAVHGVSLTLEPGHALFLVGANGAGKTTLLRTISGDHAGSGGQVRLGEQDLSRAPAHMRARSGLGLVPEGRRLFADMSVRENLLLGATTGRAGRWTLGSVLEAFPMLGDVLTARAGRLSGGQQQAVAIGRALMGNPDVLMIDEVSLGLSPSAVEIVYAALTELRRADIALLIVEQDLSRALAHADEIAVMVEGEIVLRGKGSDLTQTDVTNAYFGTNEAAA